MPIEIRELVIKATVTQNDEASSGLAASSSSNNVSSSEEIINACVEKIMEILKDKNER
jgi:hypothetical protein